MTRHPLSERFHELLAMCGTLHDSKQADYGRENDPFANIRGSLDFGVPPWIGAMLRGNDKMRRVQKAATQVLSGQEIDLKNESMGNSLFDLAVYCLISVVMYEEEHGVKIHPPELDAAVDAIKYELRLDPTTVKVKAPLSSTWLDVPKGYPLQYVEQAEDVHDAMNRVQRLTYRFPSLCIVPRLYKDAAAPVGEAFFTSIHGLRIRIDENMRTDEFVLQVERGDNWQTPGDPSDDRTTRLVEMHHFRFRL